MPYLIRPLRSWRISASLLLTIAAILFLCLLTTYLMLQDVTTTLAALDATYDPMQTAPKINMQNQSEPSTTACPPCILLVSAFFPLPTSKHTPEEYAAWLGHFLVHITTPVHFYTPPSLAPTIRALHSALPMILNTMLDSPFDVPPLKGLEAAYAAMHAKDREGWRHTPELYAVWNAKPWLLVHALDKARARGEEWDYAFWCDTGSFHAAHGYRAWPDAGHMQAVFGVPVGSGAANASDDASDDMDPQHQIFIPLAHLPPPSAHLWTPSLGPLDMPHDIARGSFFGRPAPSIPLLTSAFYAFHNMHLARGTFVGKDQTILNALLLLHPTRFRVVVLRDADASVRKVDSAVWGLDSGYLGACGMEWFYYQWFLVGREEREVMRVGWVEEAVRGWAWAWEWLGEGAVGWWKERQRCRLTRVVGVGEMLGRVFGEGWRPPVERA